MSYPGRDSPKDIAMRLREAEPRIEETDVKIEAIEQRVDGLPTTDEYDPGDLTVVFDNKLL